MSVYTLVRIMKIAILNNIHQCKSKRNDVPQQQLTHELYTFFQNQISCHLSRFHLLAQFHTLFPTSFIPHNNSYIQYKKLNSLLSCYIFRKIMKISKDERADINSNVHKGVQGDGQRNGQNCIVVGAISTTSCFKCNM